MEKKTFFCFHLVRLLGKERQGYLEEQQEKDVFHLGLFSVIIPTAAGCRSKQ